MSNGALARSLEPLSTSVVDIRKLTASEDWEHVEANDSNVEQMAPTCAESSSVKEATLLPLLKRTRPLESLSRRLAEVDSFRTGTCEELRPLSSRSPSSPGVQGLGSVECGVLSVECWVLSDEC